jgi:transcriptional regulator with XRE-family HTH domain
VTGERGYGQQLTSDQAADGGPGPVAVAFGEKIRSLRGDRSVRDFAKLLGVSHGYLSDVEHGKTKPGRPLVQRIEATCGAEGALLPAYRELLDEWDARKQAMAERRREIARKERDRRESSRSTGFGWFALATQTRRTGRATDMLVARQRRSERVIARW